jgi:hypothetical protein
MPTKEQFIKALETLRKNESENKDKVKFNQSVDLLINLIEIIWKHFKLKSIDE